MGPSLLYKTTSVRKRKEEMVEAIEFLDVIYGDTEGYVNIVTMDPLDEEETVKSKFIEWPGKRDFAQRYLSMREDENTYCSVGVFTDKIRSGDDEGAMCGVVWAEADTCPPSEFAVEPSLVVRTSRNRTHCWWILDTPHPLAECSEVARSIYQKHRDKGCDSGWQASKLLRVPGSINTKYGADYPVRVVENTGAVYAIDDIKAAYPVVRLEEAKKVGEAPPRCSDEQLRVIEEKLTSSSTRSMYSDEIDDGRQSWSQTAKRFQMELFRSGFDDNEVYQLMLRAHCNKYNPVYAGRKTKEGHAIPRRDNWEQCTWKEVEKFSKEYKDSFTHLDENGIALGDESFANAIREYQTGEIQLLTDDEVAFVESDDNPTFVKDYIDYGRTVTDTADAYHAALGIVTMATTIGAFGSINTTGDDEQGLRFWPLILGPSGTAHKTTAVNGAQTVIDSCSTLVGRTNSIKVASDSTIQAMKRDIAPFHNTPTYMALDEIQDKFRDIMDNRGSWNGFDAGLCKLFSGEVEMTRRITTEGVDRANAHLNVILTGIYDESIDILEMRNFKNGFLTRFTWVTYIEEDNESKSDDKPKIAAMFNSRRKFGNSKDRDRKAQKLAHTLASRVNQLCRVCYKTDDVPDVEQRLQERAIDVNRILLDVDDEALDRYETWCLNVQRLDIVEDKSSIFESAFRRLCITVPQVAGLFSLMDRDDGVITKTHMLNAIYYANHWVRCLLKALNDVTASNYVKQQESVITFIRTHCDKANHAILCTKVRDKFPELDEWMYKNIISSLRGRGLISGPVELEYIRGKSKTKKSKGWFYTLVVDE